MNNAEKTKKADFIELKFTGYANGVVFDSNILEDLKKINPEAKEEQKIIIIVGEAMVVPGFDKALEEKGVGKEYEIEFSYKEGYGERKRELMKVISLNAFKNQEIYPQAGMIFTLDGMLVKVLAVSGARVTVDFNNPLAGKDLKYKFKIVRKIEDEKEKVETVLKLLFRFAPEFSIEKEKVVVKGPKILEQLVEEAGKRFKELIGKELAFEEEKKESELEKVVEEKKEQSK